MQTGSREFRNESKQENIDIIVEKFLNYFYYKSEEPRRDKREQHCMHVCYSPMHNIMMPVMFFSKLKEKGIISKAVMRRVIRYLSNYKTIQPFLFSLTHLRLDFHLSLEATSGEISA